MINSRIEEVKAVADILQDALNKIQREIRTVPNQTNSSVPTAPSSSTTAQNSATSPSSGSGRTQSLLINRAQTNFR